MSGLRRRRSEIERVSALVVRARGARAPRARRGGSQHSGGQQGAPTISIYTTPAISAPHFGGPSREAELWTSD